MPPWLFSVAGRSGNRVNLFDIGPSSENCPVLSEAFKPTIRKEHDLPSYDCSNMQTWFQKNPTLDIGTLEKSPLFVDSENSELTNSQVPGPFSVIPCAEYVSCDAPVVPLRRKPIPRVITYIPIAVQALPCFPASEMVNSRWRKPKGLSQTSTTGSKKLPSNNDLKSHPRVGIDISPNKNCFHPDFRSDSNSATQFKHSSNNSVDNDSESCASQKFPWLENDMSFSQVLREGGKVEEPSQGGSCPKSKAFYAASQVELSFSKGRNQVMERKQRRNQNSQVNTKRILDCLLADELQQNASCRPGNGIKAGVSKVARINENAVREREIDLNTLEISNEDDVPSIIRDFALDIDLGIPLPGYEARDTLAAENLMIMSLGLSQQFAPVFCDSLHWFANVVSSEAANVDHGHDDEDDDFESSILKLKEMKPDEYASMPLKLEDREDESDPDTISHLLTKTRRGLLRKRRQKKDFQKDVLPGLVPLTRHEVTEDLHAFDCLMRAMGEDWQCNLTRRITGRKGSGGQGRGRGRPRNFAVPDSEKCPSSPSTQPAPSLKVEISERSIIGWGRTTRRGRRPRVKPCNATVLVT